MGRAHTHTRTSSRIHCTTASRLVGLCALASNTKKAACKCENDLRRCYRLLIAECSGYWWRPSSRNHFKTHFWIYTRTDVVRTSEVGLRRHSQRENTCLGNNIKFIRGGYQFQNCQHQLFYRPSARNCFIEWIRCDCKNDVSHNELFICIIMHIADRWQPWELRRWR